MFEFRPPYEFVYAKRNKALGESWDKISYRELGESAQEELRKKFKLWIWQKNTEET